MHISEARDFDQGTLECCDIIWIVNELLSAKKDKESLVDLEICLTYYKRIRNLF